MKEQLVRFGVVALGTLAVVNCSVDDLPATVVGKSGSAGKSGAAGKSDTGGSAGKGVAGSGGSGLAGSAGGDDGGNAGGTAGHSIAGKGGTTGNGGASGKPGSGGKGGAAGDTAEGGVAGDDSAGGGESGAGVGGAEPVVLATTGGLIEFLATGASDLYWLEEAGGNDCDSLVVVLKKIPFSGTVPETVAQVAGTCPVDLAVNATDAYLRAAFTSEVVRVPLDGSPTVVIAPGVGWSGSTARGGVALDETSVYFSQASTNEQPPKLGAILKAPLLGGPVETLTLLADASSGGGTDGAGGVGEAGAGGIGEAGAGGSGVAGFGSGAGGTGVAGFGSGAGGTGVAGFGGGTDSDPTNANDLAVDESYVYYTVDDGTVMRVSKTGGVPEAIATGQPKPQALVVDEDAVYWTNDGDGRLMKLSKSGGPPTALSNLATLEPNGGFGWSWVSPLALDGTFLYFRNRTAGEVLKVSTSGGATKTVASSNTGLPSGMAIGPTRAYWASDMSIMAGPK